MVLVCLLSRRTYEELAEQALGSLGRKVVEVCTAALNLGCMVAYLNILAGGADLELGRGGRALGVGF